MCVLTRESDYAPDTLRPRHSAPLPLRAPSAAQLLFGTRGFEKIGGRALAGAAPAATCAGSTFAWRPAPLCPLRRLCMLLILLFILPLPVPLRGTCPTQERTQLRLGCE